MNWATLLGIRGVCFFDRALLDVCSALLVTGTGEYTPEPLPRHDPGARSPLGRVPGGVPGMPPGTGH